MWHRFHRCCCRRRRCRLRRCCCHRLRCPGGLAKKNKRNQRKMSVSTRLRKHRRARQVEAACLHACRERRVEKAWLEGRRWELWWAIPHPAIKGDHGARLSMPTRPLRTSVPANEQPNAHPLGHRSRLGHFLAPAARWADRPQKRSTPAPVAWFVQCGVVFRGIFDCAPRGWEDTRNRFSILWSGHGCQSVGGGVGDKMCLLLDTPSSLPAS